MKLGAIKNAVATLALGLGAWTTLGTIQAQPLYDRVNVNLPYTVTIGEKTLQPGEYVIQQLPSQGNDKIVLIYSDNGMKFQTSAMAIPALDPNTARDTKLELHQLGNDYYLQKIWIQGKDYGYEFPLPDRVKSREKEMSQPVDVAARYSTTSSTDAMTTSASNSTTTTEQTTPPPVTSSDTAPQPVTSSDTTPAPVTDTTPQPEPQPSAQGTADRSMDTDANRSTDSNNDTTSMPHTSAGWLLMLLSGGTLSGAGLALRRRR
jgi:hypothetical protein